MTFTSAVGRTLGGCVYNPRKRLQACLAFMIIFALTAILICASTVHLAREDLMEERVVEINSHLQFLKSQYKERQEDVMSLQAKVLTERGNDTPHHSVGNDTPPFTPEVLALLKNMSGTKSATGVNPEPIQQIKVPFVNQLLPHLMNHPDSLKPAYHLKSPRLYADVVMGIPTVKREKENYLMITLQHLISGLSKSDYNTTLIVVMIGEVDLEYVLQTAKRIEDKFPKELKDGLLEVISPPASYYPDLNNVPTTLGDSSKRVRWRTKQNLDTLYLMAVCHLRGVMYLMLEDDVVAKKGYMQEIKKFTAQMLAENPNWIFIEYCQVGGIGKLFKSSDLVHFIVYVQLFYSSMPIDWLLESYLSDRVCSLEKTTRQCGESKIKIRPKYKTSLFQHIGLYSSLKGKIQKVKDTKFGHVVTYYPHNNPRLKRIETNITEHGEHTLLNAYRGKTFFWGVKPKKGDVIEFWFAKPTELESFTLRSGNAEHVSDKFTHSTIVEAIPFAGYGNHTFISYFDEFGLADGWISKTYGLLAGIRLRVLEDCNYWVILSEIKFVPRKEYIYGKTVYQ